MSELNMGDFEIRLTEYFETFCDRIDEFPICTEP